MCVFSSGLNRRQKNVFEQPLVNDDSGRDAVTVARRRENNLLASVNDDNSGFRGQRFNRPMRMGHKGEREEIFKCGC